MTVDQILTELKSLGTEKMRQLNLRRGAGENQYGVKMGDLRVLAKKIKTNHALALDLWKTGNVEAQLLAILILKPKELSTAELEAMVREATYTQLADWLNSYVVKQHPAKETRREAWIDSGDPMLARSGWSLIADRVYKSPNTLDFDLVLDRIEREMATAPEPAQWTMNYALAAVGIVSAEHRVRAITIGEKLGIYRDYPTPKGCTSPFAPIWITEMVKRRA